MKTFKFLSVPKTNETLFDFIVYLCNFCGWNNDHPQFPNSIGVQFTEWGEFYKTDYTWQDNDSTLITFRYHQNDGNIYTIKVQRDYNWHTHEYTDFYVPDRGIRHNNPPTEINIQIR